MTDPKLRRMAAEAERRALAGRREEPEYERCGDCTSDDWCPRHAPPEGD